MKEIVIASVRYSDNLGDGVIGDCLEYLMRQFLNDTPIKHLDIAGRTGYEEQNEVSIERKVFDHCPSFIMPWLVLANWHIRGKSKVRSAWATLDMAGGGTLVFGGGQILSDQALNFPLKFQQVCHLANAQGMTLALSGVGVGTRWSRLGRHLFSKSLREKNLAYIALRDQESVDRLQRRIPDLSVEVELTVDPAVWVSEAYSVGATKTSELIGIGVSSPAEIKRYLEVGEGTHSSPFEFWEEVVLGVISRGKRPVIFTNGAAYDEAFKEKFLAFFQEKHLGCDLSVSPRPCTPRELVILLSSFGAVVSHRLHANIICYALGTHSVGISWDSKLRSFFSVVGRLNCCLEANVKPADLVNSLLRTDIPIDDNRREILKSLARTRVQELCQRVGT